MANNDSRADNKGRIIELRLFGGLTMEETSEVLQISHVTGEREWNMARAWLYDLNPAHSTLFGRPRSLVDGRLKHVFDFQEFLTFG